MITDDVHDGVVGDDESAASTADEQQRRILEAAEGLIAIRGVDGVRLRDISKAAGVSIGLIQYYFETRDEVVRQAVRLASRRRAEQWAGLAAHHERASDQMYALLDGSITDRERCVLWIETCAASTRHDDVAAEVEATNRSWKDAFEHVLQTGHTIGEFPHVDDAETQAAALVGLVDGLILAIAVRMPGMTKESCTTLLHAAAAALIGPGYSPTPKLPHHVSPSSGC